jgi:signal transduction histidine kinase
VAVKCDRLLEWAKRYAGDLAIVAISIGTFIEIATTTTQYKPVLIPLTLFMAPALLFRRQFPLAAPSITLAAVAIAVAVDPTGVKNVGFFFYSALAATVTLGATVERRIAFAGGAMSLALITWVNYKFGNKASDYAYMTSFFAAAWFVGFILRSRTHQASEARERAERAEQERELRARTAVAEERTRIARELHDIVGHSVSVMTVQAAAVRRLLRDDQVREREALESVEETGRAALTEMRRLVGVLRRTDDQPALVPQPSLEYVTKLVQQACEAGLPTELHVEGETADLPQGIDLTAYRLIQEGLTNALKHAKATHADVVIRYDNGTVELVVRDDGTGDGSGESGGHGLVGMRERVAVVGGELHAGPHPDGGFELRARLPVTA